MQSSSLSQPKMLVRPSCSKTQLNRYKKFYTPKLDKASLKAELSADHRIDVNIGGEITTEAPTQALP